MPKLTVLEELQVAIDLVARETPTLPSREVAQKFYAEERELLKSVEEAWIVKELARQIQRRRSAFRREADPQQIVLGFKLPQHIEWRSDEKIAIEEASLWKIRQHRILLSKLHIGYKHPSIAKLDKLIAVMEPYAREHHGITWGEVAKAEAGSGKERERDRKGTAGKA